MKVLFSRLAKQELDDALRYYELEHPGLGRGFKEEVRKGALRIAEYPEAWSIERSDIRKCPLHRVPYKLLYSIEKDHVVIAAVAHLHRKPDYRVDREKPM